MVSTPVRVLLFLGGGAVAAGATAYVSGALDPWIYGKPAEVASVPDPATADQSPDPAAPKDERLPGAEGEVAAEDPAKPADAAEAVLPTFDVLRVEKDGSMLIAGKAAGDAQVEALSAETALAKTQSGPEGDFAIVLDQPLKPGDYEIRLRSTDKAGVIAMSAQTAIVSVPETPEGEVLAMIETPGEASEIITAPEPEKPADVAVAPAEEKPADVAEAPAEEKPADVAEAPAEEKPADVAEAPAEEKPADVAEAPAEEKPADVAAADPAAPAEEKPAEEKPAEIAAVDPEQPAATEPPPAVATPIVSVEAVEIEGNKVFVAGAADPNRIVRVYANEIHLGDAKSSPDGRFLVEAVQELPVGSYIIRADLLGDNGSDVLARAAVPFEREPGESVVAVAPEVEQPAEEKPADVAEAPAEEKPADVAAADPAQPAAPAEEKPADVAEAPAEEKPADVAAAPEQPAAPAEEKPADVAVAPAEEKPADVAVAPAEEKPADVAAAPEQPAAPAEEKPADVAAAEPEQPEGLPEVETEIAAAPPEVTAPPLQAVKRAVIIRRGDSLWRISRRAYGHGVRYSTLYLANLDQIRDPDKIWPGQLFTMPNKTQEGEEANWEALGDQVQTQTE